MCNNIRRKNNEKINFIHITCSNKPRPQKLPYTKTPGKQIQCLPSLLPFFFFGWRVWWILGKTPPLAMVTEPKSLEDNIGSAAFIFNGFLLRIRVHLSFFPISSDKQKYPSRTTVNTEGILLTVSRISPTVMVEFEGQSGRITHRKRGWDWFGKKFTHTSHWNTSPPKKIEDPNTSTLSLRSTLPVSYGYHQEKEIISASILQTTAVLFK